MQEDENGKLKQEDTYANLHARVLQTVTLNHAKGTPSTYECTSTQVLH